VSVDATKASVLNSRNLGETPLTLAASQSYRDSEGVVADHGADANTKLRRKTVMKAADRNHGECSCWALEADVNLQDSAGTALMWAVHRGYGGGCRAVARGRCEPEKPRWLHGFNDCGI